MDIPWTLETLVRHRVVLTPCRLEQNCYDKKGSESTVRLPLSKTDLPHRIPVTVNRLLAPICRIHPRIL